MSVCMSRTVAGHWEGLETWKSGFRTTNKVSRDVFFRFSNFPFLGLKTAKNGFCSICQPFQIGSWPNLSWGTTMGQRPTALSMVPVDWTQRSGWLISGLKTAYLGHFRSDLDQTWHEGSQSDSDQLPLVCFRLTEHSVLDDWFWG